MISAKICALSLLLVSSSLFARVQLHTQAELKNSVRYGEHGTDITFQIDAQESLEVYNHDNVRVVASLLAEEETRAIVCFTIYAKNAAGEFEEIATPVIVPNYTEPAHISMSSPDGEAFTLTVEAQKV